LTKISNSDHVLILLRAQLERAKKAGRTDKAQPKKTSDIREGPVARVRSLALYDNLSQVDLARALVSGLLLEHFGEEVVNAAKFQGLVDEIISQLGANTAGKELLDQATIELLGGLGK
jgi:hypothetical protein